MSVAPGPVLGASSASITTTPSSPSPGCAGLSLWLSTREALLDATARLVQPDAVGLDNTIFMSRTNQYEDHYDIAFDPVAAEQLLVDNGCVRDGGGTYECGGTPSLVHLGHDERRSGTT